MASEFGADGDRDSNHELAYGGGILASQIGTARPVPTQDYLKKRGKVRAPDGYIIIACVSGVGIDGERRGSRGGTGCDQLQGQQKR